MNQNITILQNKSPFLVTGAAGFIGAALVIRLLKEGEKVIGIDSINNYYDKNLKLSRLANIRKQQDSNKGNWTFYKEDLVDYKKIDQIFKNHSPEVVFHLAAQAGVRYSLKNASAYVNSNLVAFGNILESCRHNEVKHLVYASSSSVYGGNELLPFKEEHSVDHPISLYAATKKSNELMAHSYSHLYKIPITGLRFFTVYGPWGRPDMAPMIFTKSILANEPISIFNYGKMQRDFTFIDDIIEGVIMCGYKPATLDKNFNRLYPNSSTSFAPHRIFNIGNNEPINLLHFIELLEKELGVKAIKKFKPIQPGDVIATYADTSKLKEWIGFSPNISIEKGVEKFINWYKTYNNI